MPGMSLSHRTTPSWRTPGATNIATSSASSDCRRPPLPIRGYCSAVLKSRRSLRQDWSADGKWLAVQLVRKDKTAQIGLVGVTDGSLRVLKSVDGRGSSKLFFSPDSKYLAYDLPTTDTGNRRDVFILSIDGSREIPAVVHPSHDVLMGWSPDGKHLLFTSDRTGSAGLWALALSDGKPQGTPEQIKVDVTGDSMGLTSKGALYLLTHHSNFNAVVRSDIQVAEFDFAKGQFLSTPALGVESFVGANNQPAWSPDGKSLAFLSQRGRGDYVIVILSHDTGQLHELQPQLKIFPSAPDLRWSPDGLSLAIQATDAKGRQGIFRIDATTGEATPIVLSSFGAVGGESVTGLVWAPDGKRLYYIRINPAVQIRLLSSATFPPAMRVDVIRRSEFVPYWDLSPDGKYWVGPGGDFLPGAPVEPGQNKKMECFADSCRRRRAQGIDARGITRRRRTHVGPRQPLGLRLFDQRQIRR